jgi:hypothetical protein
MAIFCIHINLYKSSNFRYSTGSVHQFWGGTSTSPHSICYVCSCRSLRVKAVLSGNRGEQNNNRKHCYRERVSPHLIHSFIHLFIHVLVYCKSMRAGYSCHQTKSTNSLATAAFVIHHKSYTNIILVKTQKSI